MQPKNLLTSLRYKELTSSKYESPILKYSYKKCGKSGVDSFNITVSPTSVRALD